MAVLLISLEVMRVSHARKTRGFTNGIYYDLMAFTGIYYDLIAFTGIYYDLMRFNRI